MRRQYQQAGLAESDLAADPMEQFRRWYADWETTGVRELSTMTVSTVDAEGWPACRAVLLKGIDQRGFVFFTNRESAKGRALDHTGRAALTFVWDALERQVRVVGEVERVSAEESDEYFASRPRGSQIGAWASTQSEVVDGRGVLVTAAAVVATRFPRSIPRPPHWGGYRVLPVMIEFWQGRPDRLHDRLRFRRDGDSWTVDRLAP